METQKITLTVDELSKRLGVGINQSYELVRAKDFPSIKIGRRFLVPIKDLDNWLSEQARKGKANECL